MIIHYTIYILIWIYWFFKPHGFTINALILRIFGCVLGLFSITVALLEIYVKKTHLLHTVLLLLVCRNTLRYFDFENSLESDSLRTDLVLIFTGQLLTSFPAVIVSFLFLKFTICRAVMMCTVFLFQIIMYMRITNLIFPGEKLTFGSYFRLIVVIVIFSIAIFAGKIVQQQINLVIVEAQRQAEFAYLLDRL